MKKVILALVAFCVSASAMQDGSIQDGDIVAPQPMHMHRSPILSPVHSLSSSSRCSTPTYLSQPDNQENNCDRCERALCYACCGCCLGCIKAIKLLTKNKID